jgi:hypothetical protein
VHSGRSPPQSVSQWGKLNPQISPPFLTTSELTAVRENSNPEHPSPANSVLVTALTAQVPPLLPSPHYVPASCTLPPAQWDASPSCACTCGVLHRATRSLRCRTRWAKYGSSDLGAIKATIESTVLRLTSPLFIALQSELLGCLEGATKPAVYRPAGRPHPAQQQFQLLAPHAGRVLRRYAVDSGGACKATKASSPVCSSRSPGRRCSRSCAARRRSISSRAPRAPLPAVRVRF